MSSAALNSSSEILFHQLGKWIFAEREEEDLIGIVVVEGLLALCNFFSLRIVIQSQAPLRYSTPGIYMFYMVIYNYLLLVLLCGCCIIIITSNFFFSVVELN